MKRRTLILALLAGAAVFGGTSANGQRCAQSSWNPELYSLYGKKEMIVEKLGGLPLKLSERRVFLEVTQGDSSANVKLYEKQTDGSYTVTEWTTKETSHLLADIDEAMVSNKGVNCVGEQVKAVLGKDLKDGKVTNAVAAPATSNAAFAHAVNDAVGDFIKCTIIMLC
jgi:FlaG/FlaF family flagellin (archaellin)